MPGTPVATAAPLTRKTGNEPVASVWHETAGALPNNASSRLPPRMPHGLVPWVGAHPQSTLQIHAQQVK